MYVYIYYIHISILMYIVYVQLYKDMPDKNRCVPIIFS